MSNGEPLESLFEGLSSKDTRPQESQRQQPFHIVLIDIEKAAREVIHCVEKPLNEDNLKYIALSYRWGELHETVVDTKVGYTANVRSFDLNDLYDLCYTIKQERNMKTINYLWVDAICVEQANYERRKATIRQMSSIYKRATYILAVPDLHLQSLINISRINETTIQNSIHLKSDIYHLIHGNTKELVRIESEWLDKYNVPKDPAFRCLLTTFTDYFADGLMMHREHHIYHNDKEILDHIYETNNNNKVTTLNTGSDRNNNAHEENQIPLDEIRRLHTCDQMDCPLDFINDDKLPKWRTDMFEMENRLGSYQWKEQIYQRGSKLRQSVDFMADLIKDWSTRVWVISEYNIAKENNNMMYWFTQLYDYEEDIDFGEKDFTFFKFDFEILDTSPDIISLHRRFNWNNPVYLTFHKTMIDQLKEQSFFEMLLKSKASKHEDRFYAIFPLTTYKDTITNKVEVDSWNIDTLTLFRLKLFELLSTLDKLNLLFLSGHQWATFVGEALPTFVTSCIDWDAPMEYIKPFASNDHLCNFDLNNSSAITRCKHIDRYNNSDLFYLNLKPKEYYVQNNYNEDGYDIFKKNRTIWNHLQGDNPCDTNVLVCIPSFTQAAESIKKKDIYWDDYVIYLNGNFDNNIWMMQVQRGDFDFKSHGWVHYTSDGYSTGFNIY